MLVAFAVLAWLVGFLAGAAAALIAFYRFLERRLP